MINKFRGKYGFLSNFYSCIITYEGLTYTSVEAAFQASKTLNPNVREKFTRIPPDEAKKLGRRVNLRDDWESCKLSVMEDLIRIKFSNEYLKTLLLNTSTEYIEEGNSWGDTYWGTCNGVGENHLGKILMKVRDELIENRRQEL